MYEYKVLPQPNYEVIDGDTIKNMLVDLGFGVIVKVKARLARINAPELDESMGPEAQKAVKDLIEGKKLRIKSLGLDKFGRALVELYVDDTNVSDWLIERGLAKKYG